MFEDGKGSSNHAHVIIGLLHKDKN
jgi:hypothetical protein